MKLSMLVAAALGEFSWRPPAWLRRAGSRRVGYGAAALVGAAALAGGGYLYYASLPKPLQVQGGGRGPGDLAHRPGRTGRPAPPARLCLPGPPGRDSAAAVGGAPGSRRQRRRGGCRTRAADGRRVELRDGEPTRVHAGAGLGRRTASTGYGCPPTCSRRTSNWPAASSSSRRRLSLRRCSKRASTSTRRSSRNDA